MNAAKRNLDLTSVSILTKLNQFIYSTINPTGNYLCMPTQTIAPSNLANDFIHATVMQGSDSVRINFIKQPNTNSSLLALQNRITSFLHYLIFLTKQQQFDWRLLPTNI